MLRVPSYQILSEARRKLTMITYISGLASAAYRLLHILREPFLVHRVSTISILIGAQKIEFILVGENATSKFNLIINKWLLKCLYDVILGQLYGHSMESRISRFSLAFVP